MVIGAAVDAVVDAAAGGWQGPVTFVGLAALVVLAIIRGWLIPKSSHEREIGILNARIAEAIEEKNEWRGTASAAEKVSAEVRRQNADLLEVSKTTAYALDELRRGLAMPRRDVTPQ